MTVNLPFVVAIRTHSGTDLIDSRWPIMASASERLTFVAPHALYSVILLDAEINALGLTGAIDNARNSTVPSTRPSVAMPALDTEDVPQCLTCEQDEDDCVCMACTYCETTHHEDDLTSYEVSVDYDTETVHLCDDCDTQVSECSHNCGTVVVTGWNAARQFERAFRAQGSRAYLSSGHCDDCGTLCQGCAEDMSYCEDCDVSYCDDYSHADCRRIGGLHYYSYTPDLQFRRVAGEAETVPHFGLELEISSRDESDADAMASVLGYETHFYCKEDGSVQGFEAVSHPSSYAYWSQEIMPALAPVLAGLRRNGADAEDNGIHVHVGRTAFTGRAHLARFVALIDCNADDMSKVARRRSDEWASYGQIDRLRRSMASGYTRKGNALAMLTAPHGARDGGRYRAVNLSNHNTVEVRVWQGSLDETDVLGAVAFMAAAVEYTRTLTVQECMAGALTLAGLADWAQYRAEYAPVMVALAEAATNYSAGVVRHTMPA